MYQGFFNILTNLLITLTYEEERPSGQLLDSYLDTARTFSHQNLRYMVSKIRSAKDVRYVYQMLHLFPKQSGKLTPKLLNPKPFPVKRTL